jgi:hypothetical protein
MRPEDILSFLRARPFEPFRIYMSDGSQYEIHHPELAIVERSKVIVGVPGPKGPEGPAERSVFCALDHITRAERVDGAPGGGNGR